jgi:DNA-binding transcriptional LysR family regulator
VVRKDHPRIDKRITASMFKRERHVAITAPGTGHELLESELHRVGVQRQLALSLPTLPGLGNLLAQTDLMATVPQRVAQMLMRIAAVKALPPPHELPTFAMKQHWHGRFHQDPANRWLRSLIVDLFLDDRPRNASATSRTAT